METHAIPPTIADLAATLEAQDRATAAKLRTERLTRELASKRQPRKPQAEPIGLFEQKQEELF